MKLGIVAAAAAIAIAAAGCASGREPAGPGPDGRDAGRRDAGGGRLDAGEAEDASVPEDAFVEPDAGPPDAGPPDVGPPDTGPPCRDMDGDGFPARSCGGTDCNDTSAAANPDAAEICDGMDNDCDGTPDDGFECPRGATPAPCTTECGGGGMAACDGMCARAACVGPAELCGNSCDDDGDGAVDEMCVPGAVPNDTCSTAIDIAAGGTFVGDTCGADDTVTLGIGPMCPGPTPAGTPDIFYTILPREGGSSYSFTLTEGFAIQYVHTDCSGNGGCGGSSFGIGGGGPTMRWWFAIERIGGGCGPFMLGVSGM